MYVCVYMYIRMCVCMYVCVCTCVCKCILVHLYGCKHLFYYLRKRFFQNCEYNSMDEVGIFKCTYDLKVI